MTQQPLISPWATEAWRAKEARASEGVPAEWGDVAKRGVLLGDDHRHRPARSGRRHRGVAPPGHGRVDEEDHRQADERSLASARLELYFAR